MRDIGGYAKEQVNYYRLQAVAIVHEGETRIRDFLQWYGTLENMRIPGFDQSDIPVLEKILKGK